MTAHATSTVDAPEGADSRPPLLDDGSLVVLSYCFPPMSVGPAFILERVLGRYDLADVLVFAGDARSYAEHTDAFGRTNAKVVRRDVPRWWPRRDREIRLGPVRIPLRVRTAGNLLVAVRLGLDAARALRRDEVRGLLAVYPKQSYLFAACLAARTTRKPFAVYFTDVYVEGLPRGRRVARRIERYVARRASVVFAMSEPHREQLEERLRAHGVAEPHVVEIPHPYVAPATTVATELPGEPSILFTGAIYDAQGDSIRRLVEALDLPELEGLDPRLHLFSQLDPEVIAEEGIRAGGRVTLRSATSDETLAAQRGAGILYLPIAFGALEAVRQTASPTKLPEYLASGRPILVHAPPDAYVSRYAREHGFAEIVDVPDPAALAAAVRRLATDEARCAELVAKAEATLERHLADRVAATFRDALVRAMSG